MQLFLDKGTCNIIKFGAAIMVAMSHFSQYVGINDPSTNIVYKLFSSQGGYLGVAVFFFLSGYGLMESEQRHHLDIASFLKKRFLKVYLPVVLVTALWIPVFYCILNPTSMDQETVGGGNLADCMRSPF